VIAGSVIDALPVGVVHDDGMYVILAKALATGRGFHWINVPGDPAASHFPPGYPAVLSLVWRAIPSFPANVIAFKILNAVLLAAAAALLVVFARRRLAFSPPAACGVVLAGALAVPTLVLSTIVMSEMLFLALLISVLLFAERAVDDASPRSSMVLGLFAGLSMLVRSHGVALVIAVAVVLAARRKWRSCATFSVFALATVAPWMVWQRVHRNVVPDAMRGDYESYGQWFAGGGANIFATIAHTSRDLLGMLTTVLTAGVPIGWLRVALALAAVALFVFGLWRMRERALVTAVFLAAYLAIVLVWPFAPARFVWGIWPLLVLVVAVGARALSTLRVPVRAAGYVALAGLALGYGTYNVRGYRGSWWSSIPRQNAAVLGPTIAWIRSHTRPTDVVSTNAEAATYLYAGRLAVPATRFSASDYAAPASSASAAAALRSILETYHPGVVAVVANVSLESGARALAAARPPMLAPRDSVPHGLLFTSMVSPP